MLPAKTGLNGTIVAKRTRFYGFKMLTCFVRKSGQFFLEGFGACVKN